MKTSQGAEGTSLIILSKQFKILNEFQAIKLLFELITLMKNVETLFLKPFFSIICLPLWDIF